MAHLACIAEFGKFGSVQRWPKLAQSPSKIVQKWAQSWFNQLHPPLCLIAWSKKCTTSRCSLSDTLGPPPSGAPRGVFIVRCNARTSSSVVTCRYWNMPLDQLCPSRKTQIGSMWCSLSLSHPNYINTKGNEWIEVRGCGTGQLLRGVRAISHLAMSSALEGGWGWSQPGRDKHMQKTCKRCSSMGASTSFA